MPVKASLPYAEIYMIKLLNSFKGIEFNYGFKKTQTLEEIEESILENQKILK